jgi:MFS family permease
MKNILNKNKLIIRIIIEMQLQNDEKKYILLIYVHLIYLCTESFLLSIIISGGVASLYITFITFVFDENERNLTKYLYLLLEFLLILIMIIIGASTNAFLSYAFDISFYRGNTSQLIIITTVVYALIILYLHLVFGENMKKYAFEYNKKKVYVSSSMVPFNVLILTLLIVISCFTQTVIFAEPYTFGLFYLYAFSVWGLCFFSYIFRKRSSLFLMSYVVFLLLWLLIIMLGSFFYSNDRRRNLNYYFTSGN